ncbi:MAG: hypothetical protein KAG34_00920 [Cocleimonas sp.]|nr:hypothetical protein [Cocleimonas sp.]
MKIRILLLSSNPRNSNTLRLSEEFRKIKDSISRSQYRDSFEITQGDAVRPKDLRRLILDKEPHIVHFSGHAEKEGIFLENDQGYSQQVSGETLEELFALFDSVCCIVLNSCYSKSQAKHLVNVLPFIIGMNSTIKDSNAIDFSVGFYDAIAAGKNILQAFEFGVNAIKLNKPEHSIGNRTLSIEEYKENDHFPVLFKGKKEKNCPKIKNKKISKKSILLATTLLTAIGFSLMLYKSNIFSPVDPIITNTGCLNTYLKNTLPERIIKIEAGAHDVNIIGNQQTKDKPIALILEENKKTVASLIFSVFTNNQIFKIDSIVDHNCKKIETFSSDSGGGNKYVLQNWGELTIRTNNKKYSIRLEYISGRVSVNHFYEVK